MNISAIIAIHEVDNKTYRKSLDSIYDFVDEIIIADIGMSRRMRDDLERLRKIKFVDYPQGVPYIELIRQKLTDMAKGDWILYLDPDEIFPKKLLLFLKEKSGEFDHFSIPRKNIIFNRWMQHSRWWPDYQIRFYKKESALWGTIIHSQPELSGEHCDIPADESYAIEHYNYLTYDQYAEKSRRYARGEAEKLSKDGPFTLMRALQLGTSEFMSRYFASDGYKDGMHGFVMAFSQLMYYFQVYVYYWEQKGYPSQKNIQSVPVSFFNQALYESLYWMRRKKLTNGMYQRVSSRLTELFLHKKGA